MRASTSDALARWFADALVSPVLTAHPTEVQRKSILDCEREIARLLMWRDRTLLTPVEAQEWETSLHRQVLTLWQTAMLRLSKLKVHDEIDNGLAYYRYTFLAEVPRLYETLAADLARHFGDAAIAVPPFFRMGSWIGGDRDGNPFVVADTLAYAIRAQARRGVRSLPRRGAPARRRALAVGAPRASHAGAPGARRGRARRQSASAGRAVPAGADRRLRAARGDGARAGRTHARARAARGARGRTRTPREFLADLAVIEASLATHGAAHPRVAPAASR